MPLVRCLLALEVIMGSLFVRGLLPIAADDAPPPTAEPKKVALLVGVNEYLKPGFTALRFAEADVLAVGEELRQLGFEVTILLGSGEGDAQATRANIEAAARRMVEPLGENDIALVMLAGHGQQLNPTSDRNRPNVDVNLSESYYCPFNAVVNQPESQFSLSLLMDEILARDIGRKLLLVDACRDVPKEAGPGARNRKGIEGRLVELPEDTAIFFSCRAGQLSFEREELGHGLFTHCVLEGLREKAIVDGDLAWDDLVAYTIRRMAHPDLTQYMPAEQRQVPIQAGAMRPTVLGTRIASDARPIPLPTTAVVETLLTGSALLALGNPWPAFLQTSDQATRLKDGLRLNDRNYMVSRAATYLNHDFVYEIEFMIPPSDDERDLTFIGFGDFKPGPYAEPQDSVYLRIPSPHSVEDQVGISKVPASTGTPIGPNPGAGRHLARIVKVGSSVTFSVDVDMDGPSPDDLIHELPDVREYAPFLHDKNTSLFFGGAAVFRRVSVTLQPAANP